jgi:hypothetical protein
LSGSVSVEAAAPPDGVTISTFEATGQDGKAEVIFDVGASHGTKNSIECTPSCGTLGSTQVSTSGANGLKATISGYTDGSTATVRLRSCNGSSGSTQTGAACSAWVSATTTTYGDFAAPTLNASGSGQCLNWSYSGNANGKPVHIVVRMSGSTIVNTTSGNGAYSNSGQQCVGYSQTRDFTIDVTDTAGSSRQARHAAVNNVRTDDAPVSLSLSKGASAQGQPGCTDPSCRYIVATTSNFPASVTCHITAANPGGTDGFLSWSQAGNETKQSPNYYGWSGGTVSVTCGGGGKSDDASIKW